jgi:tRNA(fMet)-specific endonuclease VapC
MKRYLLDSNAVTSLINKREPLTQRVREARQQGCRIGTCEPVVAELFYGMELSASRVENLVRLRRALSRIVCWPLDRRACETYGRLAADLRRRGRPMQTVDMMLAAVALSLGNCTVVTTDSDLSAVPGLEVENWEVSVQQ